MIRTGRLLIPPPPLHRRSARFRSVLYLVLLLLLFRSVLYLASLLLLFRSVLYLASLLLLFSSALYLVSLLLRFRDQSVRKALSCFQGQYRRGPLPLIFARSTGRHRSR